MSCYHTAQGDKRLAKQKHLYDADHMKSDEEPILKRPSPGDSLKVGAQGLVITSQCVVMALMIVLLNLFSGFGFLEQTNERFFI